MAELKTKNDLIVMLEDVFKKAPALPANAKETLVKITPWIALIFGVLGILAGLGEVGVSPIAVFGGVRSSAMILVSGILTIVSSVMMLMAYPKTKAHAMSGWTLLFWSTIVSLVASLILGSIISAIVWGAIELYLLFQIKSYYK